MDVFVSGLPATTEIPGLMTNVFPAVMRLVNADCLKLAMSSIEIRSPAKNLTSFEVGSIVRFTTAAVYRVRALSVVSAFAGDDVNRLASNAVAESTADFLIMELNMGLPQKIRLTRRGIRAVIFFTKHL